MRSFRTAVLVLGALLWAGQAFAWGFAVCGDSRDDKDGIFPQILSAVDASDMEFLLHTGDLVTNGTKAEWEAFRAIASPFRKPLRVVAGNHDVRAGTRERFAGEFGLPGTNYSFRHRDAHFAIVDNAGGSFSDNTLSWLDREWSTSALEADQVGWDWFALQLDDGRDLMFYRLRRRDGNADPFSSGTLVAADGTSRHLTRDDVHLAIADWWTSPASARPSTPSSRSRPSSASGSPTRSRRSSSSAG